MNEHRDDKIDSDMWRNGDAIAVFRVRKRCHIEAIFCLMFFVLVGIGFAYGLWIEGRPDRRIYSVLFVSMFFGFWVGFSCWALLACWRERLTIRNDTVIQQCVIRTKEFDLHDIREARWKLSKSGRITLKSLSEKLSVHFDNFEPDERLWLIRHFRNRLPASIQDGWELFCHKIATPLRDYDPTEIPKPSPQEATITRRRWDWYFIPFILLSAVIGIVMFWQLRLPRMLAAPILPVALWLLLRFGTPRQGMVAQRVSGDPDHKRLLVFELWWFGISIAGFVVFNLVKPPMPQGMVVAIIATILWSGVFLWKIYKFDCARQQRETDAAAITAQQWNETESSQPKW